MTITADGIGAWPNLTGRGDPVALLQEQDATRLRDLIPVRHERMAVSPFTFYRGAAAVMAADLASTPNSGITTQLCGDAHLSNFGLFLSPERHLVFDLNDLDETHPGPFEWDVKRLAASMTVAAQGNGSTDKEAHRAARRAARAYRKTIIESNGKSALRCWYDRVDSEEVLRDIGDKLDTVATERMAKVLRKSRHRNSEQALSKLCVTDESGVHIRSDPPLLIPAREVFPGFSAHDVDEVFHGLFESYRKSVPAHLAALLEQYTFVEAARKVVGVGSVGTRCWIALFAGRELGDPLFLQLKEASRSVLAPYTAPSHFRNQGHRVVFGQQLMQASSDILLGWLSTPTFTSDDRGTAQDPAGISDFYVRQLRDGKGSVVIEDLSVDRLTLYGELCGTVLAQAHARSTARAPIARCVDGLGKSFDRAVADWSVHYSAINAADHSRLVAAIAAGDVEAAPLEA